MFDNLDWFRCEGHCESSRTLTAVDIALNWRLQQSEGRSNAPVLSFLQGFSSQGALSEELLNQSSPRYESSGSRNMMDL